MPRAARLAAAALVAAAPSDAAEDEVLAAPNPLTLLTSRRTGRGGSLQLGATVAKGNRGVVKHATLTLPNDDDLHAPDNVTEVVVKYATTDGAETWLADECGFVRKIRAHAFDNSNGAPYSSRVANCVTLISAVENTQEVLDLAIPTHGQELGMLAFQNVEPVAERRREMYIMEPALMTMAQFMYNYLPFQSADEQAGAILELIRCTFQAVQEQFDAKVSHNDMHPNNVLLYGDNLWRVGTAAGMNDYPPSACRFSDYGGATLHRAKTLYGTPSHLDFGRVCAKPDEMPAFPGLGSWSNAQINTWENKGKEMTAAAMLMASALLIHDCTPNATVLSQFSEEEVYAQVDDMSINEDSVPLEKATRALWAEMDANEISNRLVAASIWHSCEDNSNAKRPHDRLLDVLSRPPMTRALKINAELGVRLTTAMLDLLRPSTRDCQKSPIEVLSEIEKLFVPGRLYKGDPTEDAKTLSRIVQEEVTPAKPPRSNPDGSTIHAPPKKIPNPIEKIVVPDQLYEADPTEGAKTPRKLVQEGEPAAKHRRSLRLGSRVAFKPHSKPVARKQQGPGRLQGTP